MEREHHLSDKGLARRRALILSNGYWWFRAENIPKDPRYAPLAITTIDEIYAHGRTPREMWKDYFEKAQDVLGPATHLWHQWIGVGVYCTTDKDGYSHYWATIILVGACSSASVTAPAPTFTPYMCCDLPDAFTQCSLPHGAAFFYAYDAWTRKVEPVCCSSAELEGSFEVPPQVTNATGYHAHPPASLFCFVLCCYALFVIFSFVDSCFQDRHPNNPSWIHPRETRLPVLGTQLTASSIWTRLRYSW